MSMPEARAVAWRDTAHEPPPARHLRSVDLAEADWLDDDRPAGPVDFQERGWLDRRHRHKGPLDVEDIRWFDATERDAGPVDLEELGWLESELPPAAPADPWFEDDPPRAAFFDLEAELGA